MTEPALKPPARSAAKEVFLNLLCGALLFIALSLLFINFDSSLKEGTRTFYSEF